jgi:hypothetical protein
MWLGRRCGNYAAPQTVTLSAEQTPGLLDPSKNIGRKICMTANVVRGTASPPPGPVNSW